MLHNGHDAPQFSLQAEDSTSHTLTRYREKPLVMLFFRGKFCPTSKRYLINWQEFYRKIHNLGAHFVAISYDPPETQAWMKQQYDLRFPILSDPDLAVSKQYGVYISTKEDGTENGEPAIVIIDKNGKVAYSVITSGPKGLPAPGDIAPLLIYMFVHGGLY